MKLTCLCLLLTFHVLASEPPVIDDLRDVFYKIDRVNVSVSVDPTNDVLSTRLKTKIEFSLRQSGLNVVDTNAQMLVRASIHLARVESNPGTLYTCHLGAAEFVTLEHDGDARKSAAEVWSSTTSGWKPSLKTPSIEIAEAITELAEEMGNAVMFSRRKEDAARTNSAAASSPRDTAAHAKP